MQARKMYHDHDHDHDHDHELAVDQIGQVWGVSRTSIYRSPGPGRPERGSRAGGREGGHGEGTGSRDADADADSGYRAAAGGRARAGPLGEVLPCPVAGAVPLMGPGPRTRHAPGR
jgi:hypothetical protein